MCLNRRLMRADLRLDLGHKCKEHPISVFIRLATLFELLAMAFLAKRRRSSSRLARSSSKRRSSTSCRSSR